MVTDPPPILRQRSTEQKLAIVTSLQTLLAANLIPKSPRVHKFRKALVIQESIGTVDIAVGVEVLALAALDVSAQALLHVLEAIARTAEDCEVCVLVTVAAPVILRASAVLAVVETEILCILLV